MISLHDRASILEALHQPIASHLKQLLSDRIGRLAEDGLLDLTHLLIVQPGDTEADIQEEIGLSPLVNPLDGSRFGAPTYQPFWDWLEDHQGWFEMIITVGNSGFAYVIFIEDAAGLSPTLRSVCRQFAA